MEETCKSCKFWSGSGGKIEGECHKNPPQIFKQEGRSAQWPHEKLEHFISKWPVSFSGDSCGEFKPKVVCE